MPDRSLRFGAVLRQGRESHKLTQATVADLIGVKQSTVSAWETSDAYPTAANLVALADLYGLDAGELLKRMVDDATPEPVSA